MCRDVNKISKISDSCKSIILHKFSFYDVEKIKESANDIAVKSENAQIAPIIQYAIEALCKNFINELNTIEMNQLIGLCINAENIEISPSNIPQFSSFLDGTEELVTVLRKAGNYGPTFKDVGEHLLGQGKKTGAYVKYGENHVKLASIYNLVYIDKDRKSRAYLTELGKQFEKLNKDDKRDFLIKMSFSIPVVQYCIKKAANEIVDVDGVLAEHLSPTTVIRRRSNVKYIINLVTENYKDELYKDLFENMR